MAENDRVVYPDEVEEVKAAANKANSTKGGDSSPIDDIPEPAPVVEKRNMIQVPKNCPPGYKMGIDGVCREVFD